MMSSSEEEFCVGDRIVVFGLAKAKHLNGRHGCVARGADEGGRVAIDLDLDPKQKRANVRPSNLRREPPIPEEIENQRAEIEIGGEGILVENHGRAVSHLLDSMRYIAACEFLADPEIKSIEDVENLRVGMQQRSLLKMNYLTATGWSNWSSDERGGGQKPTTGVHSKDTMFNYMKHFLQVDIPKANKEAGIELPDFVNLASESLDHPHASGGWHLRVTGEFWVCGMDTENGTGTYLVSKANHGLVYKVLGLRNSLFPMIRRDFGDTPVVMSVTMVPWYGRLVYDGVIYPAGNPSPMMGPKRATDSMARKLREAVEQAKNEGRVIERLRELEVPGGTRVPITIPVEDSGKTYAETEQAPITAEEEQLVNRFRQLAPYSEDDMTGQWVFRRMGYTEKENPEHCGLIMHAGGGTFGMFHCSALDPTPMDILKSAVETSENVGRRPYLLLPDGVKAYERMKYVLKDCPGTHVEYYRPPSVEEERAATMLPSPDFLQF